jgi:predicted DNA binding CopG/RHH family protein
MSDKRLVSLDGPCQTFGMAIKTDKPTKLREARISVRFAPSELARIETKARAMGVSASTWIRIQALAALRPS